MRLFSIVFNDQYIDWFDRGCVRSLSWPSNLEAIQRLEAWDIWTTKNDAERVWRIANKLGLPIELNDVLPESRWEDKEKLKAGLTKALVSQIDRCEGFLWVAPDSIFGDGSIRSFLELASVPMVSVSTAPMRVEAEGFIEAMGDGPLDNPSLVKLAFERAHKVFRDAEATLPKTNSLVSGVSWRRLSNGLYAITHRCHSAYVLQPTKADAKWFRHMNKFGSYDHSFPKISVESGRHRVIGSSDAAFVVELTPASHNIPPLTATDPAEPDRFNQDLAHHKANRHVVCIWREGGARDSG